MPTCNTRPTATAEALWCTNICYCRGQNSLPERRSNIFLTLCYYGYIIINCITLLYTVDETQIKHSGELSESTNEHALFNSFLCLHVSSSHQKIMFKKICVTLDILALVKSKEGEQLYHESSGKTPQKHRTQMENEIYMLSCAFKLVTSLNKARAKNRPY